MSNMRTKINISVNFFIDFLFKFTEFVLRNRVKFFVKFL